MIAETKTNLPLVATATRAVDGFRCSEVAQCVRPIVRITWKAQWKLFLFSYKFKKFLKFKPMVQLQCCHIEIKIKFRTFPCAICI